MSFPEVLLKDIATPKQWKTLSKKDLTTEGFPVYGANGKIGFASKYTHEFPTLMITCRGATCGNVHISDPKSYINGNAMALDNLDESRVDIKYLYYILSFRGFGDIITGTAQPQITAAPLRTIKIPLPPLEEQKRIASILDKADNLRRLYAQRRERTEELLRSTFLDMFGDPVTNPKGWEVKKLGDLLEFLTSGARGWAKYYSQSGSIFIRIQNVKNTKLSLDDVAYVNLPKTVNASRTKVKPNDVLLSITADLGRTAVIPQDFDGYISQHLALLRLKPNTLSSIYLAHYLESVGGKRQMFSLNKAAVKAGLNFSDIRSIEVPIPSKDIQQQFETAFHKISHLYGTMSSGMSLSDDTFNSLLQRAFKGEL